jgi:hypothetical protein
VSFRQRFEQVEKRRSELVDRLSRVTAKGNDHPGYRRASKLLNDIFRNASLEQRPIILGAATWFIDILEKL